MSALAPPSWAGAYGVMFHRFRDASVPALWQGAVTADEFETVLRGVGLERFLHPEEWMARLASGRLAERDRCVTFDDGLRCQFDIALPVLDALGLSAFWFVYTRPLAGQPVMGEVYAWAAAHLGGMPVMIREFLARCPAVLHDALATDDYAAYVHRLKPVAPFYSDDDLRFRFLRNHPALTATFEQTMDAVLADHAIHARSLVPHLWMDATALQVLTDRGHVVGLHSHDHPYAMETLSRDEQHSQYAMNLAHLEAATGRRSVCMSHPLNSYNADTLEVLTSLDVRCGFRANLAVPPGGGSRLELPRDDSANLLPSKSAH